QHFLGRQCDLTRRKGDVDDAAGHVEIALRQFFKCVVWHAVAAREFGLRIGEERERGRERGGEGDSKRDRAKWPGKLHDAAPRARFAAPGNFARNAVTRSVRSSVIAASNASPFFGVASVGSPKLPERLKLGEALSVGVRRPGTACVIAGLASARAISTISGAI